MEPKQKHTEIKCKKIKKLQLKASLFRFIYLDIGKSILEMIDLHGYNLVIPPC
ncbi:hypothetical protein RV17_GL000634 [Enterococcus thailandicus]|nr:hypothetical protein RV17_GL000634 [Enterococcus thailandicus]